MLVRITYQRQIIREGIYLFFQFEGISVIILGKVCGTHADWARHIHAESPGLFGILAYRQTYINRVEPELTKRPPPWSSLTNFVTPSKTFKSPKAAVTSGDQMGQHMCLYGPFIV